MSYNYVRDGYAREATFGSSAITAVGDTTYLFGAISEESEMPSTEWVTQDIPPAYNKREVSTGGTLKTLANVRGMYGLTMQNGVLLQAALGKSTTAGEGPYTHTIVAHEDGTLLDSFTLNHEEKGAGTDEEYQALGCKVDSLLLYHDLSTTDGLIARVEWLGKKTQDGIALTNAPALPATANASAYMQLERTWDANGTPVSLDGLSKVEVLIGNGLSPKFSPSWDGGTYTGYYCYAIQEAPLKTYRINLEFHPNVIERAMWDEHIATGNTKDMTFKWIRSANDYILITATNCHVIYYPKKTPRAGTLLVDKVVIKAEKISAEVKDSIAGGAYGE